MRKYKITTHKKSQQELNLKKGSSRFQLKGGKASKSSERQEDRHFS